MGVFKKMSDLADLIFKNFARLIGFVSRLLVPIVELLEVYLTPIMKVVLPYYIVIGLIYIVWLLLNHRRLEANEQKLEKSKTGPLEKALDQMENAFIRVETKRRKKVSQEYFEHKLKTIEEKK